MNVELLRLATQANLAINSRNDRLASNSLIAIYNAIQRDSTLLLDLPGEYCQVVGLALTGMALLFNWNDDDINSVAAENAYYCLAKSFLERSNTWCLPAIFTMLQKKPNLLIDKFIAYWTEKKQDEEKRTIGLIFGGNPFNSPHLRNFRQQALSHRIYVQQFALSNFYNENSKSFLIPSDLNYYLPSISDINTFILSRKEIPDYSNVEKGKEIFKLIYDECEETLRRF